TYSVAGGEPTALEWDESGAFNVGLVLSEAVTAVEVSATDGAGNLSNAHLDIVYSPVLTALDVSPKVAERGATVTLTGSGFGPLEGSVSFSGLDAEIRSWTETEVTVTVPPEAPGGWSDLQVNTTSGTLVLNDFFVGIEVETSNLNNFFA